MTDLPTDGPTDGPTDEPADEPSGSNDEPVEPTDTPADPWLDDPDPMAEPGDTPDIYDALEAATVDSSEKKAKKKDKDKGDKVKKDKKKAAPEVIVQQVTPAWVRWAGIATVVVLVALAVVAVQQGRHADDVSGQARDRKAAEQVAGQFSETLFTFEAAKPTAHLDLLKQLATKAYQPRVDEARQTALAGSSSGAAQASMTAHVTDVYLTELVGDTAHAVTRSDWVLTASGQTLALDLYLQIDLKREGGSWKVNTVSALTAKQPPGTTPTTTGTTDTTPTTVAGTATTAAP